MWFGKGERMKQDIAVRPFKIRVEDKVIVIIFCHKKSNCSLDNVKSLKALEDLKTRIEMDLTRLAPPLEGAAFHYGFNTDYLKEVARTWCPFALFLYFI